MYKLFTFSRSSTAWRARIALNLKNIKPQYVYLHLLKGQHRNDQYKKINPNMSVPSLVLPDGQIIFQSMAIIQYLNQVQPNLYNLFPGTPVDRAKIRAFCQVINSGIHPYQNLKLMQKIHSQFGANQKQWLVDWMSKGLNTIQGLLQLNQNEKKLGNYSFGNQITAADIFLYPQVLACRNRAGLDLAPYSRISKVLKNLQKIKQFTDANPENQPDFQKDP